jgi:hypothetical protein
VYRAVLYLPNRPSACPATTTGSGWTVDYRDEHNFGEVPVVRFPNRQRSSDREGRSEITPAIMATTDSACRTLLGMEIAREFYSIPHRYILGAQESDFMNADGTAKTALQMSMNKFLALERDEEGNVPTVGQFTAYDPSVFTKIIDEHAQLMASYTGYPPSYFGQTSTANPASADAIRVSRERADPPGAAVPEPVGRPAGGRHAAGVAVRQRRRRGAGRDVAAGDRLGGPGDPAAGLADRRHVQAGADGRDPGDVGRDAQAAGLVCGGAGPPRDRPQARRGRAVLAELATSLRRRRPG